MTEMALRVGPVTITRPLSGDGYSLELPQTAPGSGAAGVLALNAVGFAEWRNERADERSRQLGQERRALLEHSTGVTEGLSFGAGTGSALRMATPATSITTDLSGSHVSVSATGTRAALCHSGNSVTLFERVAGVWTEVVTHAVVNGSSAFPSADADTFLRGAVLSADGEKIAVLVRSLDGGAQPILTPYFLDWSGATTFDVAATGATAISGESGSLVMSGDATRAFYVASASAVVQEYDIVGATGMSHTFTATVGAGTVAGGTFGRTLATDFFGVRLALKGADDLVVADRTAVMTAFGTPMTVAAGSWTPAAQACGVAMTWDGKSVYAVSSLLTEYGLVRYDIDASVLTPDATDVYVMGASADLGTFASLPAVVAATPDGRFVAVAVGNNGGAAEMAAAVVVTADPAKTPASLSYVHALDARGNAFQVDTRTEFPGNNGVATGVTGAVRYIPAQAVLGRTVLPWTMRKVVAPAGTLTATTDLGSIARVGNPHQTVDARESLLALGTVKELSVADPEQLCFAVDQPLIHRFLFRPRDTFLVDALNVELPAHGVMALYINRRLICHYSKSDLGAATTVYAPADIKTGPLLAVTSLASAFRDFPFEEGVTYEVEVLTGLLGTSPEGVVRVPLAQTFLGGADFASAVRVGSTQYFELDPVQTQTMKAGFDPYAEPAASVWAVENIATGLPGDAAQVFLNGTYLVARTAAGKYYISNRVLDQGTTGAGDRAFRLTGPAVEFITNDRQAAARGYQTLYLRAENGPVGGSGVAASAMATVTETILDTVRAYTTSVASDYTYTFALEDGETNVYTISYAAARNVKDVNFDYFFAKALATADGDVTITVESRATAGGAFTTLTTHTLAGATTGDRLSLAIPAYSDAIGKNVYQLRVVLAGATLEDADIGVIYAK